MHLGLSFQYFVNDVLVKRNSGNWYFTVCCHLWCGQQEYASSI